MFWSSSMIFQNNLHYEIRHKRVNESSALSVSMLDWPVAGRIEIEVILWCASFNNFCLLCKINCFLKIPKKHSLAVSLETVKLHITVHRIMLCRNNGALLRALLLILLCNRYCGCFKTINSIRSCKKHQESIDGPSKKVALMIFFIFESHRKV